MVESADYMVVRIIEANDKVTGSGGKLRLMQGRYSKSVLTRENTYENRIEGINHDLPFGTMSTSTVTNAVRKV